MHTCFFMRRSLPPLHPSAVVRTVGPSLDAVPIDLTLSSSRLLAARVCMRCVMLENVCCVCRGRDAMPIACAVMLCGLLRAQTHASV